MTVQEILNAAPHDDILIDGELIFPKEHRSAILVDVFSNCVVDRIMALNESEINITLKMQPIRKEN